MGEEFLQLFTHSSPLFTHLQFPKKKMVSSSIYTLQVCGSAFMSLQHPPKKGEEG